MYKVVYNKHNVHNKFLEDFEYIANGIFFSRIITYEKAR